MSTVRPTPSGRFELAVRNKLLLRPLYFTFDTEEEANEYGSQCDKWLEAGIVPESLKRAADLTPSTLLGPLIRAWTATGHPSKADQEILGLLFSELCRLPLKSVTYTWAEQWVRGMKQAKNLAPGTIRKRVGALSRALDWQLRKTPDVITGNPLSLLPVGYSSYNEMDAAAATAMGGEPKTDIQRDRRLDADEETRILAVLDGFKRPDRERSVATSDRAAMRVLFLLIINVGLRLREAYRVRRGQISLATKVLRIQSSKQWRGRIKHRDIPLTRSVHALLVAYLATIPDEGPDSLIFPFWDGEVHSLTATTNRLSQRFKTLFDYADCPELTEHDLRHEATCRWFELRKKDGHYTFQEAEILRIMGWAPGSTMGKRYASFRADDMADRLWAD